MASPYFAFPGLSIMSGDFVLTQGTEPSVCRLVCDVPPSSPQSGTLTFSDGQGTPFTFSDCAIKRMTPIYPDDELGLRLIIDVVDRRWKWEGETLNGQFNIHSSDGTLPSLTAITIHDLAVWILAQLGESPARISFPDNAQIVPASDWMAMPATEALEWLCKIGGASICLGYDDRVYIDPANYGDMYQLPIGGELCPLYNVTPTTIPGEIEVDFGPTTITDSLLLTPVGLDVDGKYRRLADLTLNSHMSIDWYHAWPGSLQAPASATSQVKLAVALCNQTMFRTYAPYAFSTGTLQLPHDGTRVSRMSDVFPILPRLDIPDADPGDSVKVPCLVGSWFTGQSGFWSSDTYATGHQFRLMSGFTVDEGNGIVHLDEPLFTMIAGSSSIASSQIDGAGLSLICSFNYRTSASSGLVGYSYKYPTGYPGASRKIIKRYDRHLSYVTDTVWNMSGTSVAPANKNTKAYLDIEASREAAAALAEIAQDPISHMKWVGFKAINPSGHIKHVRWQVGRGITANTTASRNTEELHVIPGRDKRHQKLNTKLLMDPDFGERK